MQLWAELVAPSRWQGRCQSRARSSSVGLAVQLSGSAGCQVWGRCGGQESREPPVAGLKPPLGGACLMSWWPCVSQQLAHTTWGEGWHSMGQPSPQAGGPAVCAREEGRAGSSPCAHPCAPCFRSGDRKVLSTQSQGRPSCQPRPGRRAPVTSIWEALQTFPGGSTKRSALSTDVHLKMESPIRRKQPGKTTPIASQTRGKL